MDQESAGSGKAVPPDAVRVWRGYRLATLSPQAFLANLGSIFLPITMQMQRLYGLTAYLPTVLPLTTPAELPDEIALVFYESQQAYTNTKQYVGGRAYSLLHPAVTRDAKEGGSTTIPPTSCCWTQGVSGPKEQRPWGSNGGSTTIPPDFMLLV
jgi:hypothetical protein